MVAEEVNHYVKFFPDFLSIFELEKFLLHF